METSSEEEFSNTPPEIAEIANSAACRLIPEKSKFHYERAYKEFKEWCGEKKAVKVSENILLAYLEEKSQRVKASTLWAIYSMLKCTLLIKENIEARKFCRLIPYLKNKSIGYRPKKSKILTREEINKFMLEADNNTYLLTKVVLIMGISGACRREELTRMTIDDIEDKGSVLVVKIPDTKTYTERTFTVTSSDYINLYRKYAALRPNHTSSRRFFIKFKNGKCFNQVVGINKIGGIPSSIAKYLGLPRAECYTGHCFRHTSATLLADAGADISCLKRHGGWKSSTVAEGYVEDSIENKIKISNKILDCEVSDPNIISPPEMHRPITGSSSSSRTALTSAGINITACHDCTINVNIVNNNNH